MIRLSIIVCLLILHCFLPFHSLAQTAVYEPSPGGNSSQSTMPSAEGSSYERGKFLSTRPKEIDGESKPRKDGEHMQISLVPVDPEQSSQDRKNAYSILFHGKIHTGPVSPAEETKNPAEPRFHIMKEESFDDKEVTKPGQKTMKGGVAMGLKVSPATELLIGRGIKMEKNAVETPLMKDDGWRFRIQTNF